MNKKYKTLINDTLIFALGSIGSKLILFFLVPLYTNCLTQEQYGTSELVFTLAQIFIPIISLVIFDAVIRFGLERREHPENVFITAICVWIVGAFISFLLLPLSKFNCTLHEWKWYLYFYVISNILLSIELNYIKVKGNNFLYSIICIIQTLCLAGLNIYLLLVKKTGVSGYLLSNNLSCIVCVVCAFVLGRLHIDLKKGKFEPKLTKQMVFYSAPLIFNNLAWWVIQSSDKVMIQYIVGSAALGLYSVATRIPSLINVVVSVFQQSWGISAIIEMDSDKDNEFYANVFKIYTCVIFFACILLNSIIKYFMKFYVNNDYYIAWQYTPLLVCSAGFSAVAAYYGSVYGALKKSFNNMVTTVTSGIINIIINMFLIPKIGVMGAVIGTLVSYCYLAYVRMFDCLRYIKIKVESRIILFDSILIIIHGSLIACDYWISYLWSIIAIVLFIIINYKSIWLLFIRIKKLLFGTHEEN